MLLGGPFDQPGPTFRDVPTEEYWVSDLLIVGDGREAMSALADQVSARGLSVSVQCSFSDRGGSCDLMGSRRVDGFVIDEVQIGLAISVPGVEGYAGHIHITHLRWPPDLIDRPDLEPPGRHLAPLPAPQPAPAIPLEGDPVVAEQYSYGGPPVTVAQGARIVAPVRTLDVCATGGYIANLEVAGDVDDFVEEYRRQFAAFWEEDGEESLSRTTSRGRESIHLTNYASGGGDVSLDVLVGRGTEPTWARLSRCND